MQRLAEADPDVPDELHDRAADNWRPLLDIANAVGGDWPERARAAAAGAVSRGGGGRRRTTSGGPASAAAQYDKRALVRYCCAPIGDRRGPGGPTGEGRT